MKKYIGILFLFMGAMSFAQDSHLGLNMGPSFPTGSFAQIDDYNTNAYAQPGFILSFDANYIPTWYFGIGGALSFGTNYPNQDSMLSGLIEELRELDGLPNIPEEADALFTIGNWSYVNVLVGPTFAYPAGKLQFNLRALIGLSLVMPPNQTLTLTYDDNIISGYSDTQTANFCYSLGADIIFKLSGSYSLKLGTEYFHTRSEYAMDINYQDNALSSIDRKIDISTIHTSIGFAYLF